MGMVAPPRVLPEGVPADAEPITEDQLERLPDYAQALISQFMELKQLGTPIHHTSREELERVRAAFFAAQPAAPVAVKEVTPASNSTACEEEEDGTDMHVEA